MYLNLNGISTIHNSIVSHLDPELFERIQHSHTRTLCMYTYLGNFGTTNRTLSLHGNMYTSLISCASLPQHKPYDQKHTMLPTTLFLCTQCTCTNLPNSKHYPFMCSWEIFFKPKRRRILPSVTLIFPSGSFGYIDWNHACPAMIHGMCQ